MWKWYFTETTFTNDRQKAEVMVTKQDEGYRKSSGLEESLDFMLPVTLPTWMEPSVVKKGTLIQKATTGADGTGEVYSRPVRLDFLMM